MYLNYKKIVLFLVLFSNFSKGDKSLDSCKSKPCGKNAICVDSALGDRYCKCKCGYFGDPEKVCDFLNPEIVTRGEAVLTVNVAFPIYLDDKKIIDEIYELGYPLIENLVDNIPAYYKYSLFLSRIR